jgi:hypothetical protein
MARPLLGTAGSIRILGEFAAGMGVTRRFFRRPCRRPGAARAPGCLRRGRVARVPGSGAAANHVVGIGSRALLNHSLAPGPQKSLGLRPLGNN